MWTEPLTNEKVQKLGNDSERDGKRNRQIDPMNKPCLEFDNSSHYFIELLTSQKKKRALPLAVFFTIALMQH